MIFCIFSGLDPFPQVFGQVERVTYVRTAQNNKIDTYSCVSNCFYFILLARLAGRSVQSYEK